MKEVTVGQLAETLGLTTRRVQQYVSSGVFKKAKRGIYPLAECVQAYVDYMIRTKQAELNSIDHEELRLKKTQADIAEHKYQVMTGKYADAEVTHEIYRGTVLNMRAKLLQLPRRLSVIMLPPTPREREIVLRKELQDALRELDTINPEEEECI
jgi:phage terminase Nu1 subunit (DNA packaging protein)